MHNDHDLELIAALAEDRLEDPAPAEDLVRTCPECADAFHSHRTVLDAAADDAIAPLDDLERRRLRTSVWEALEADRAAGSPRPAFPSQARPKTPWWYRVAPVAAALVVVVGVGANLVRQDGDQATATTAAGLTAPVDSMATLDAADATAGSDTTTAESGPSEQTVANTTAGAEEEETALRQFDPDELAEAAADFERRVGDISDETADPALACVADDSLAPPDNVVATEAAEVGGAPAWFVAFGTRQQVTSVNVYAEDGCEVLYRGE